MKQFDRKSMNEAGAKRFRSGYHYAKFEYYRSPKLLKELDSENIIYDGVVLDDGCGSGGVTVSLSEECNYAIGLDIEDKFTDAALVLSKEKRRDNISFIQGDGCNLPFRGESFSLVLSHSVIEHTYKPQRYVDEIYRVLKNGGTLLLETPPYYSFEGTHLPKPKIPIPWQLLLPRRALYRVYRRIGKRKPKWFKGGVDGSAMLTALSKNKSDNSYLKKMTVGKLRKIIRNSGLMVIREKLYYPSIFDKIFPGFFVRFLICLPLTRNFVVNTIKIFALRKD